MDCVFCQIVAGTASAHIVWEDVLHLHFHVIPRASGDRLVRPWASVRVADAHLSHVHAQLTG